MKKILRAFDSPTARLITAGVLMVSGVLELTESALEKLLDFEVRIHHGLIIFAAAKLLGAIAEIAESREKLVSARKEKKKHKSHPLASSATK